MGWMDERMDGWMDIRGASFDFALKFLFLYELI